MKSRSACVSVDLDALVCYTAIHGLPNPEPGPDPVLHAGLQRFLELFDAEGITATFFVVGRDLDDPVYAELLRQAAGAGHELANHTENHHYDLRSKGLATIADEIAGCEKRLLRLTGHRCVGFRTPGYNLSPDIAQILAQRGYVYDSSVFPCPPYYAAKGAVMAGLRALRRPSRSQMTLPGHLRAPRAPYRMHPDAPFAPNAHGPLWEIPMAVSRRLRLPIIGTTLPIYGMPQLDAAFDDMFNLEFHAIDLVDDSDGLPPALVSRQHDARTNVAAKRHAFRAAFKTLRNSHRFRTLADATGAVQP